MRSLFILFCCLAVANTSPAFAQEAKNKPTQPVAASPLAASAASGGQIDISADESLEWHQDKRLYLARGHAKAIRGNVTVEADLLTAHERDKNEPQAETTDDKAKIKDGATMGGNIDLLTAEGNVHITDPRQQIFGERAIYDLDQKVAKITGNNLKYLTSKDVITARDSMEYYEGQNMALARGKAVAVHDDRRVEADIMKAHFTQSAAGQMDMSTMTAEGNVTVVTKNDIARGEKAIYDVKRNVAVLTGNVRITRGDTQLSGNRAEVDFTKGESRLLNEGKGRVRALLVPKTSDTTTRPMPAAAPMNTGSKASKKTGSTTTTAP